MNAGSGSAFVDINTGDQLGRIDIAVAPSNPNYIYAQAQSIVANNNGGCGGAAGCQIGAWASTNGGTSWTFMDGSQGGALRDCQNGIGDYPQNWYDQGIVVDPNNPERVFFDTFDVWFATVEYLSGVVAGKLIQPVNHSYLPNLKNVWPQLQSPFYDVHSRYSVPYTVYTTGIAWRKDKVTARAST